MKQIISKPEPTVILVDQLQGTEAVAYKCQNSEENYAVLAKLSHPTKDNGYTQSYGFIPLGQSGDKARYIASTWFEAVRLAGANRKLFMFTSGKEMIKAMAESKF